MAEVVETLLKYNVDQGSVAQAVAANEKVVVSLRDAQEAAASVGLTTDEFLARTGAVVVEQEAAASAIRGAAEATRELKTETDAAAEAQTKLASSGGGISAQRFGSRVAGLGSIVGGQAGGAGFRDVSQLVMLGASFGALGVAAGGAALAIRAVNDAFTEATEKATTYLTKQLEVNQLVAQGATTEDLKQKRADLIADQVAQQDVIDTTRKNLEGFLNTFKVGGVDMEERERLRQQLQQATGVDASTGTGVGAIRGVLDELQKKADLVTPAIADVNLALDSQEVAENDLAAAAQRNSDELIRGAEAHNAAERLTADERQKHVAEIQTEIDGYQQLIDSGYLTTDSTKALHDKIVDLKIEQNEYNYVLESQADIVERLNRQAEGISQMMDAITIEVEAEEDLRKARQKLADDTAQQAQELERIRLDEADKEMEDRAKTADAEEKALRSHLEKLADIEDRYRIDSETAIGDRDALGLKKAEQTHDKALKDENQSYDDRLDDLQKALDEQLRADQVAAQKQIRNTIEKWERIEAEDQRAIDQSIVDVQNANATIEAITQTNYSGLEIQAVNHYSNLYSIADFGLSMVESRFSQAFQNITGGSGASQVVGQAVEDTLWVLLRSAGIIS